MKTKLYISAVAVALSATAAFSQTSYDIANAGYGELNGTARFVGMGGAMSALGADLSTMGTNPAGIALFRSNWLSGTFGFNYTGATANYEGNTFKSHQTRMSFDQLGFVYTTHVGNRTPLRFFNIGFNYAKKRNFNQLFETYAVFGAGAGVSQTMQMAGMINDAGPLENDKRYLTPAEVDDIYNFGGENFPNLSNPYSNTVNGGDGYPYLGVMGVRTELVSIPKGAANDVPVEMIGWNADDNGFRSEQRGGIHQYDFNASFNVADKTYWGLSIGLYDVDMIRSTVYTESIVDGNGNGGSYTQYNDLSTKGSGIDLKLGMIYRPIEDSPFRVGFAIHTPTWFQVTDTYESTIKAHIDYIDSETHKVESFDALENTYDMTGGTTLRDYIITTPWKLNLSAGTVIANTMAVGAEYEYANFRSAGLRYSDSTPMDDQNAYTKEGMKGVHTLRLGLETRVTPSFSVRAGYNLTTALNVNNPDKANKYLAFNDTRTDTDFTNLYARNTFTVGLGYSRKSFFADLACKYDTQNSDFYAFNAQALPATKVNNERLQVLCSLGFRF